MYEHKNIREFVFEDYRRKLNWCETCGALLCYILECIDYDCAGSTYDWVLKNILYPVELRKE